MCVFLGRIQIFFSENFVLEAGFHLVQIFSTMSIELKMHYYFKFITTCYIIMTH